MQLFMSFNFWVDNVISFLSLTVWHWTIDIYMMELILNIFWLLVLILFFFIFFGCLVFRKSFKIKRWQWNLIDILKFRQNSKLSEEWAIFITIIRVETKFVGNFFFLCICWWLLSHFTTLILTHDFLESVGLNEFYTVFFVDFIDRDSFVL